MKKKLMLTAIVVLISFSMLTTLLLAEGPTNAGGKKPVEEIGMPLAPYNDNAWWHSGQYIGPEIFGCGTETTIVLDDVTIVVDTIPSADHNEETGEWTGTHLMWKGRYGNNYPENSWFAYKFWLNGSGPVSITYSYEDGTVVEEYATEFIFFKVRYTDNGWETTLQAYK
jgi:hypothetical protein